ncbi:MAG: TIGR02147 family protein [Fibrobacteria bacterium]|nr:TIGR02147 family protein [Fibrobacteria bacterium]
MDPNVFCYFDYRSFLKDFYEHQKSEKSFFSYRYIGQRVGMDNSFLIRVLQGVLHISNKKIDKFIKLCGFNEKEASYFESLVYFGKAKTAKESKLHFEKLLSFKEVSSKELDKNQYEFFQDWYYSAIWSLLNYYPFKGDYKELSEKLTFPITLRQAKKAVKLLEKLELIVKDEKGIYKVSDLNITTGEKWFSIAIRDYQKKMMRLAEESLDRFKKEERDISTLTMNISPDALSEINELTNQYRQSLKKLANSYPKANGVYQLNIQLFPLTKAEKSR